MRIVDWILWATVVIALALALFRVRGNRGLVVLLAAIVVSSTSRLFRDTPVEIALLVAAIPLMIWAWFLTVRQVRAQWREQMERVKHL